MGKKDKRVDAYIAKAQPFAQPIMNHVRSLIHKACPQVEETIKWGFPHFDYKGIMFSMASFKAHCGMTFWKGSLMSDPHNVMEKVGQTAMGQFGKVTSLNDLPDDKIMVQYIKEAMKLNEDGVKVSAKPKKEKKELVVPDYFMAALKKNKKALETFNNLSNSHQREYVEWVVEAKREETREKRLKQAVETMADGKPKEWKYMPEYKK